MHLFDALRRGLLAAATVAVVAAGPVAGSAHAQTAPDPTATPTSTTAAPASGAPVAPATPEEALAAAKRDLAHLRDVEERAAAQLTAATTALQAAQAQLEQARAQVAAADVAERDAVAAATAAEAQLGEFANVAYRNPVPSELSALLEPDADASGVMHSLGYLSVMGDEQADVLTAARAAREAAAAAHLRAETARADATRREADVAAAQAEALAAAADARTQLELGAAKVTAAQQLVEASHVASAAAGVSSLPLSCLDRGQTITPPTSAQWGGYPNGTIPVSVLCPVRRGHELRVDAAVAFRRLDVAYTAEFHTPICVTDSYRSYPAQVDVYARKPDLAAIPGTSKHGWGLAVDLCGGIQTFGSRQHVWMKQHAPAFGWRHPDWAEPSGSRPEPWHWEFGHISR